MGIHLNDSGTHFPNIQGQMMAHDIRPLTEADLPDLGRFLIAGFHAPADAPFAAADVLRWKYFDPRGVEAGNGPRSYLARSAETGAVVGHVGVCPARFHGGGLGPEGVSTLHMIDWLSSRAGSGVGATLMRRAHQATDTQYGFGGSADGRGVIDRGGYELIQYVPVYQRVLRPSYRWKTPGHGRAGRLLRAAKDAAGRLVRPVKRPRASVDLKPVVSFGDELLAVACRYEDRAVFTTREPALLNHFLRYPRGGMTGWHFERDDVIGFAVLSVVEQAGGVRVGKVVDCLLDLNDDALWHAAAVALTAELARQGADLAQAFAANEWSARAWRAAGYARVHDLEFRLRDRAGLVPRGRPLHLTPLEADYAYT